MKYFILASILNNQCLVDDIQIDTFKQCELAVVSILDTNGGKITLAGCSEKIDKINGKNLSQALKILLNEGF